MNVTAWVLIGLLVVLSIGGNIAFIVWYIMRCRREADKKPVTLPDAGGRLEGQASAEPEGITAIKEMLEKPAGEKEASVVSSR
jgi:hypothetical protein